MTERQIYVAIKNGFIYLAHSRWTRLGDPTLYSDDEVLIWLTARHLLAAEKLT
jgi:hypothetical protein